jgi:hypothetical protein
MASSDDDEDLKRAIALSLQQTEAVPDSDSSTESDVPNSDRDGKSLRWLFARRYAD